MRTRYGVAFNRIQNRLKEEFALVAEAAEITGWMSLFFPSISKLPNDHGRGQQTTIEIDEDTLPEPPPFASYRLQLIDLYDRAYVLEVSPTKFPVIKEGSNWLQRAKLALPQDLTTIKNRATRSAGLEADSIRRFLDNKVRQLLQRTLNQGVSEQQFLAEVRAISNMTKHHAETIQRTYAHRAHDKGRRDVLNKPIVKDIFTYRQYFATTDNRTRKTHKEMHRKVYHKASPLAVEAKERLNEWNCRCTETALTEKQALRKGISKDGEAPADQKPTEKQKPKAKEKKRDKPTKQEVKETQELFDENAFVAEMQAARQRIAQARDWNEVRQHMPKRIKTAIDEVANSKGKTVEEQLKPLEVPAGRRNPTTYNYKVELGSENFTQKDKDDIKNHVDMLDKYVSPKIDVDFRKHSKITVMPDGKRAYYNPAEKYINHTDLSNDSFTYHEYGHAIEDQLELKDYQDKFFAHRYGGTLPPKTQQLNKDGTADLSYLKTHGADPWIKTAELRVKLSRNMDTSKTIKQNLIDKFRFEESDVLLAHDLDEYNKEIRSLASYNGIRHDNGSTEAVSMGMELYMQAPKEFAKVDPEYFEFIAAIVQGVIK